MRSFLEEKNIAFERDFIEIPPGMTVLKIDVGLSENAPQSQRWIESDEETFVFGFEPVSHNIESIVKGNSNWPSKLNPDFIGNRIAIIPCALFSEENHKGVEIFVTKEDPGRSSLLRPVQFPVDYREIVPVFTLESFIELIDPKRFPIIDHVKIDVQGADFEVIKGIGKGLERILAITVEIDLYGYHGSTNNYKTITKYMRNKGFIRFRAPGLWKLLLKSRRVKLEFNVTDPTYVNLRKLSLLKNRKLFLYQNG